MKLSTIRTLYYLVSLSLIKTIIILAVISAPWLYAFSIIEQVGDKPVLTSFWLVPMTLLGLILLLPQLISSYLSYKNKQYSVEKDDITLKQGTFNIATVTVKYSDLRSIEFTQTWYQRVWNVGTILFTGDDVTYYISDIESSLFEEIRTYVKPKMNRHYKA